MSNPTSFEVSPETTAQLQIAASVGNSVCAAVSNNRSRGDQNPVLLALVADPMQVLINHGLPEDFFAGALPDIKDSFIAFLKAEAQSDLTQIRQRQVPRGFFRCWACRIGIGAVIAVLGVVITAATAGAGGPIYAAVVSYIVVWGGLALATAQGIMTVGAGVLAGGIAALIEFICEQIPDTC